MNTYRFVVGTLGYMSLQFVIPDAVARYNHPAARVITDMSRAPPSIAKYLINGLFMPVVATDMMDDLVRSQIREK